MRWRTAGFRPRELRVHLGPAICGECYEVSADVYAQLTGRDPGAADDGRSPRAHRRSCARRGSTSTSATSPSCTRCDNDRFYSHRAGDAGRQLGVMIADAAASLTLSCWRRCCCARRRCALDAASAVYFTRCCAALGAASENVGEAPHIFLFLDGLPRRDVKDALEDVVVAELDAVGFDLVELRRGGTQNRPLIEVRIDRRDGRVGHGGRLRARLARGRGAARR